MKKKRSIFPKYFGKFKGFSRAYQEFLQSVLRFIHIEGFLGFFKGSSFLFKAFPGLFHWFLKKIFPILIHSFLRDF